MHAKLLAKFVPASTHFKYGNIDINQNGLEHKMLILYRSISNRRDGIAVRTSASPSVDLGFIPHVESYQKIFKIVCTVFLHGA